MDKNIKKEYQLKKYKFSYSKKSFDDLVIKRVKYESKLNNKQQDLEILHAKEEYLQQSREMNNERLPEMEIDKRTIKSAVAGTVLSVGLMAGGLTTGVIEPHEVLSNTDINQISAMTGIIGFALGAGVGNLVNSNSSVLHFIENKKLELNSLKQRVAQKQVEKIETKIEALDSTIKAKYERVTDLVKDERYEELYNIKRQRNMESAAAFFRELDEESVSDRDNNLEKVETSTLDLPKLNVRPYDPKIDGVEQVATLEELNNGYDNGCVYEADNDFEA